MTAKYELIEHTADIFIKAYGRDLAEAFGAVAEAMFLQMTEESEIAPTEEVEFEVAGTDRENLLVGFLSELIVWHEITGMVLGAATVSFPTDNRLVATGWGERFDERKHRHGLLFKAVSYHLMEIVPATEGSSAYVKVLFDI